MSFQVHFWIDDGQFNQSETKKTNAATIRQNSLSKCNFCALVIIFNLPMKQDLNLIEPPTFIPSFHEAKVA